MMIRWWAGVTVCYKRATGRATSSTFLLLYIGEDQQLTRSKDTQTLSPIGQFPLLTIKVTR